MKLYAVKNGRIPGIYQNWSDCKNQITGFKGAVFKSFTSYDEAMNYMNEKNNLSNIHDKIPNGIILYCDGACNSDTEGNAWGSVVDRNGNDLIGNYIPLFPDMFIEKKLLPVGERFVIICNFSNVTTQQNNGAELLSMVAALRIAIYCINNGCLINYILTDSSLILNHWSLGKKNSDKLDELKIRYINECTYLRQIYENSGGNLLKISGSKNKADLGWHVS